MKILLTATASAVLNRFTQWQGYNRTVRPTSVREPRYIRCYVYINILYLFTVSPVSGLRESLCTTIKRTNR